MGMGVGVGGWRVGREGQQHQVARGQGWEWVDHEDIGGLLRGAWCAASTTKHVAHRGIWPTWS